MVTFTCCMLYVVCCCVLYKYMHACEAEHLQIFLLKMLTNRNSFWMLDELDGNLQEMDCNYCVDYQSDFYIFIQKDLQVFGKSLALPL